MKEITASEMVLGWAMEQHHAAAHQHFREYPHDYRSVEWEVANGPHAWKKVWAGKEYTGFTLATIEHRLAGGQDPVRIIQREYLYGTEQPQMVLVLTGGVKYRVTFKRVR